MKSENSRIAKNTVFLYIRTFVVLIISLYTSRVILQSLGVDDYGIYNVVGGLVSMFVFINGAMSAATLRFLTYEIGKGEKGNVRDVFSMSIQIHAIISVCIILLAESIGLWFLYNKMVIPPERFDSALIVFHISVLTSVVSILNVPYNALIIAHERMSAYAYISIIDAILKLLIAIAISRYSSDRLILYAVLMLAEFIFVILLYCFYCSKSFPESKFKFVKDKPMALEMSKFAGWNLFSNLAYVTYTQGINLLLNVFFGPAVNAARGITVQVESAVDRFVTSFQSALNPQITKSHAGGDKERFSFLVFASGKYSFFLLLMFVFPLIVETPYILKLWLGIVPDYTVFFVRFSLLRMLISIQLNPLNIATQATGNVKNFFFITGCLQMLVLPLSYILLKLGCSPNSVYVLCLIHTFLTSFIYIYITSKAIELPMMLFIKNVMLRCILVASLAAIIPLIYKYFNYVTDNILSAIITIAITELSILISIYTAGVNRNERIMFGNMFKSRLKLKKNKA